jgi:hypothetical protein
LKVKEETRRFSGFSSYIIMKTVKDEMGGIKVGCFGEKSKRNSVGQLAVGQLDKIIRRKHDQAIRRYYNGF